jgi:STE24 endopeptidase
MIDFVLSWHPILKFILLILFIDFIIDTYLNYRDKKSWKQELPDEAKSIFNEADYQKAKAYAKDKNKLAFWSSLISSPISLIALVFGWYGLIADYIHSYIQNNTLAILAFLGTFGLFSLLVSLPFSYYNTFVIEEKYGFNKSTKGTFFLDTLKSIVLSIIIGSILIFSFVWIYEHTKENFWWLTWLVITAFSLLINMLYTDLLLPIFNKLKPLEDGALKSDIEKYCKKVDFKVNNVFVIDGSKRSSKANAFFSGFGPRKKIVLYDTLIEKNTNEELVAILAHEAGHYKKKHIIQSLIIGTCLMGLTLFVISRFLGNLELSKALGANGHYLELEIIVITMLYSPINTITSIFMNSLSRKNEFEADAYAKQTFSEVPLKSSLIKLHADSLSNPCPDALNVFWHYSHPPLLQRLKALS